MTLRIWERLLGPQLLLKLTFVISQGLIQAEERHGFEGDGFVYLKSPLWWAGIATRESLIIT